MEFIVTVTVVDIYLSIYLCILPYALAGIMACSTNDNCVLHVSGYTNKEIHINVSMTKRVWIEVFMNNNPFIKTLSCYPSHQTNKKKKTADYYLFDIIICAVKLNRKLKINEHGADCVRNLGNIPLSKHALLDKANKK